MNILILEDEPAAARHLQALIKKLPVPVTVAAVLDTVRSAFNWLGSHEHPDLYVSDIQLADGPSFELFDNIQVKAPVIFTTAYDEYMQRAFKLNSIDYLLKPIDEGELKAAFEKHSALRHQYEAELGQRLKQMLRQIRELSPFSYKTRFLIKTGNRLSTISTEDILFLQADDRIVTLRDRSGNRFTLDDSLDDLEHVLNPQLFFRLNRRYIAPITSIERIESGLYGKLHVRLKACNDSGIVVSREKAKDFKNWLNGR